MPPDPPDAARSVHSVGGVSLTEIAERFGTDAGPTMRGAGVTLRGGVGREKIVGVEER